MKVLAWLTLGQCREILRLPVAWVAVAFLVGGSVAAAVAAAQAHQENQQRFQLELQQRLQAQVQTLAGPSGRSVDRRLRVLRPPNPYTAWASSFDKGLSAGWDFGPAGEESLPPYPGSTTTVVEAFDIATVVRIFGGVLAVLLGVWTVTRERANGWLRAEYVLAPSHVRFQAARVLGLWLSLNFASLVWILGTQAALHLLALPSALPWQLWGPVAVVVGSFLVVMACVGLVAASVVRLAPGAQALAVAVWALWNFTGPQVLAAGLKSDQGSRLHFETEQRELAADLISDAEEEVARALVAALGEDTPLADVEVRARGLFAGLEATWLTDLRQARNTLDARRQDADRQWKADAARSESIARWSPGFHLQWAVAEATGTGPSSAADWTAQVRAHQQRLEERLFDDRPTVHLRLWFGDEPTNWMYVRRRPEPVADLPTFVPPTPGPLSWHPALFGLLQTLVIGVLATVVKVRS